MVQTHSVSRPSRTFDLPLAMAISLIVLLWIAGGGSRGDTMGQVIVRTGCWAIFIAAVLAGPRPALSDIRPVLLLLAATIALPLIQLIPLPPAWWQALPGRGILLAPGAPVSWRPWTMTPGATRNALASLIVPATMLLVLAQANDTARRSMLSVLLAMIGAALLLGLLQFSGARFNNPLLNDTPGVVSSIFANRNHFALLLAIGCLVAPTWAFMNRQAFRWRGPLAGALIVLFVLTIPASGSRTGMILGSLALVLALTLVGQRARRRLKGAPKWLFPVLVGAGVLVVGGFVALSFAADRAAAINRLIILENSDDIRLRVLPTTLSMIRLYMPFGSGFGGFDPVFRIHEPFELLKPTYFNQAHNDFLGIALDGGIAGLVVLGAGILWWLIATIGVWRAQPSDSVFLGRLGSSIILLVLVASATDYPARAPTIMAVLVIAAVWLARAKASDPDAALPSALSNL